MDLSFLKKKLLKKLTLLSCFPSKTSWDFSKKEESNDIIKNWQMTFQASDSKGTHFLELLDNNLNPTYVKGGSWIKYFGLSNLLCARATQAITNHAPIGEYCLRFFLRENFSCLCGLYPIKTRHHVLHDCRRFNNYWNLRRDTLSHFISFLEFNPIAFSFGEGIT